MEGSGRWVVDIRIRQVGLNQTMVDLVARSSNKMFFQSNMLYPSSLFYS